MASINDVAKRAKVAKSTVSLVVNNSGYVSAKTREKVEQAMRELNYVPSQLAKNLSSKHSNIVGIVMPDVMHPFFATFIKYAELRLYSCGYMTMVCSTVGREQIEESYLDMLDRKAMDGIIMGAHTLDIERYQKTTQPIVTLDRFIGDHIPVISSNHRQAAEKTVDILIKNQCKHVVQLVGTMILVKAENDYAVCCHELCIQHGIKVSQVEVGHNTFTADQYQKAAEMVFQLYPDVDAIVGVDMGIMACLDIAKKKKIKVPEELKLIAFDGTYITRIGERRLTAICQPIEELANDCVDTIVHMIEGKPVENKEIILDVSVQNGDTTNGI